MQIQIDRGAKVNARDARSYSPFLYTSASETVPVDVVRLLLYKGADPAVVAEGETAASLAAKRGGTALARLPRAKVSPPAEEPARARTYTVPAAVTKSLDLMAKQSQM